jgi:hypothetical protein
MRTVVSSTGRNAPPLPHVGMVRAGFPRVSRARPRPTRWVTLGGWGHDSAKPIRNSAAAVGVGSASVGLPDSASRGPGLIGPLFFPKGPGLNSDPGPTFRKQGIDQAGNLKPPFRASSIRRSRSDVFSASVAVFRFTPAASYMR